MRPIASRVMRPPTDDRASRMHMCPAGYPLSRCLSRPGHPAARRRVKPGLSDATVLVPGVSSSTVRPCSLAISTRASVGKSSTPAPTAPARWPPRATQPSRVVPAAPPSLRVLRRPITGSARGRDCARAQRPGGAPATLPCLRPVRAPRAFAPGRRSRRPKAEAPVQEAPESRLGGGRRNRGALRLGHDLHSPAGLVARIKASRVSPRLIRPPSGPTA